MPSEDTQRILRLARTIADLAGEEAVGPQHVSEAITYRTLDRRPQKKREQGAPAERPT